MNFDEARALMRRCEPVSKILAEIQSIESKMNTVFNSTRLSVLIDGWSGNQITYISRSQDAMKEHVMKSLEAERDELVQQLAEVE